MTENEELQLDAIAFVGETLAPFFLEDPKTGNAQASFLAIRDLDISAASKEWPFVVDEQRACRNLDCMVSGLQEGIDAEDLMWEYRRLFIGPAIKPAPPWGSVYTDRECVIFGKSTLALRAWMRENKVTRLVDDKTPEDHIGLMLVLMAWIAREKPEALDSFLTEHFFTWSSHFLEKLEEAAQHPFYEGLAGLTKDSLEGIQADRGLHIEYPRFYR